MEEIAIANTGPQPVGEYGNENANVINIRSLQVNSLLMALDFELA